MAVWHSTEEGIALLAAIDRKPAVLRERDRRGDWHADYKRSAKIKALEHYWFTTSCCSQPVCECPPFNSPDHVLGAVFGDPMGLTFRTHWDMSTEWRDLRAALHDAAVRHGHDQLARRITRQQKRIDA